MTNQSRNFTFLNSSRGAAIVLSFALLAALIALFHFTSNAAAGQGRIAYWKLDETSGPTYADYDGALDGACAGACPTATTGGQVNGAQVFDGSSAGITVTANSIMDWSVNDSFSIELWVKGDPGLSCATVDEILVGRADSGGGTGYWALGCTAGTGTASFQLRDSNNVSITLQSTRVITDGLWHHIVGTRDGVNDINYLTVDGTDVVSATQNYTGALAPATAVLSLGHLESSAYFKGTLDEVALYNGMISGTDTLTHFYLGRGYAASCDSPVAVMPLGNSITVGYGTGDNPISAPYNFGYRRPLYISMTNANYSFDFVGSLSSGSLATGPTFDYDHEGHGGYRADLLATEVISYLTVNPAEVILLHIGTNDIAQGQGFSVADVETILDNIDSVSKNSTVILAQIVDEDPSDTNYTDVTPFNTNLVAMAQNRIANGDKIILVDQQSALNYTTDMYNWLHPNESGYNKMAAVWLGALNSFMPVCDTPTITSTPVTEVLVDQPYTYDVDATGYPTPTYSLLITPTGMIINSASGVVFWTPNSSQVGPHSVEVQATNVVGSDSQFYTLSVVQAPTITSTPVTTGTINVPYSYDVAASGYPTPTYSLTVTPTGMTINATSGLIAWTPTSSGAFSVTVQAANSQGTDNQAFTINVTEPLVCLAADPIAYWQLDETSGTTFAGPINGNNASCSGSSCPAFATGRVNGALNFDGVNDGLDVADRANLDWGSGASFTIQTWVKTTQSCVGDNENKVYVGKFRSGLGEGDWWLGCGKDNNEAVFYLRDSNDNAYSLKGTTAINDGNWHHLAAVRDSLGQNRLYVDGVEEAAVSTAYTGNFANTQPLTIGYYINSYYTNGALDEVAIHGRALTATEIQYHYNNGLAGMDYCTLVAPSIFSTPVTSGAVGSAYAYQVQAGGHPGPTYSLTITPTGMTINANTGLISWTPASDGNFNVAVQSANSEGSDSQNFTIQVASVPTITSTPVTTGDVGAPYSYDVNASGTPAPTYSLIITPTGMTIDANTGVIAWTPTADQIGANAVEVQASNSQGSDNQTFTVYVNGAPTITSSAVTAVTLGNSYSYDVDATGYPAPTYSLTITPTGMTINPNSGLISWTPTSDGYFNVTVKATNSSGNDSQSFIIEVATAPTITSSPVTTGDVGVAYSYDVNASGTPAPTYSLIITPTGMTIDANSGLITWTPATNQAGQHAVEVQASNSAGSNNQTFTITVNGPPTITSAPVTTAVINTPYSYDVDASGYPTPTYSLTTKPSGMTIDADSGLIAWTPTSDGYVNVTVKASNAAGNHSQSFTIEVASPPAITSTAVTTATVGQAYSYDVDASGVPTPTYSLITNPTGMTIDANTGVITWTPASNQSGLHTVEVQASNSAGSDNQTFTIAASGPPTITSSPVTAVTVLTPYSYDVDASGYPTPTYSLTAKPLGMTINATSGLIAWTPASGGTYTVTVQAANAQGTDSQSFTIEVSDALMCLVADPIAYWPLDETSGTIFTDILGGNDASCSGVNCPTFATSGRANGARVFDGVDDGLDVADHASLDWGVNDSFTIQTWVKTTQSCTGNKVYVGKYPFGSGGEWWLGCSGSSNEATFYLRDSNNIPFKALGTTAINDGAWHHLVAVRDASTGENRLYVDGVEEAVLAANYTGNFANTQVLTIGYYANLYQVDGTIDEVAIHGRALTPDEIQQYYTNGAQGMNYCALAAPIITSTPTAGVSPGAVYTYTVKTAANPQPTYSLISYPSGMEIDANTGVITWPTTGIPSGAYTAEVQATNLAGSDTQQFTIIVYHTLYLPAVIKSN